MKDTNLVDVLRAYEEWAEWNHQETPIAMGDNLAEAADLIEAQAKEIEKLRAQAQASPVVHGRWDGNDCTVCKLPWNYNMVQNADDWGYFDPMPDYCPNCGAKMDGGADNACL